MALRVGLRARTFTVSKITSKYRDVFKKLPNMDTLISTDTLNRYVHSPESTPPPEHLKALWDNLTDFIVLCLNA
jgi:hypothetical protein